MSSQFKLNSLLDPAAGADLDDTLNTKKALKKVGHYEPPEWGLHEYPDQRMFDGIKSFQKEQGLRIDGVMRPEGETANRLSDVLSKRADKRKSANKPSGGHPFFQPDRKPRSGPNPGTVAKGIVPGEHDWMGDLGVDWPNTQTQPPKPKMRPVLFDIAGQVGRGRRNHPRDVLSTRRALAWTGDLAPEKARDQTRFDDDVEHAIRDLQRRNRLKVDGWLGRDGETVRATDADAASSIQKVLAENLETGARDGAEGDETQVAWAPLLVEGGRQLARHGPNVARSVPGIAALMEWLSENATSPKQDTSEDYDPAAPQPPIAGVTDRTDIADPPPPVPPSEPKENIGPDREEFPADPPDIPKLGGRPINDVLKTEPVIFQALSDEFRDELSSIVESHRGDVHTQWGLKAAVNIALPRALKRWGPKIADRFAHTHGAENTKGKRLPEKHLKNAKTGGRRGSSNPDLTLLDKETTKKIHINSGNRRLDGEPVAHEGRSFKQLAKNAGEHIVGFITKYRPHMDKDEFIDLMEEEMTEILKKHLGEPPS